MGKNRKKIRTNNIKRKLSPRVREELDRTLCSAVRLHEQGHLQQAELLYKSILHIDPENADSYHLLGVMAQQVGQSEKAIHVIDKAISINPHVAQFHYNRGVALQSLGMTEAAAVAYQSAVRLKSDYREGYENLGVALQDLNDFKGAMSAYRKAIEFDDKSIIAQQNMGTLLLNVGKIEEATKHFENVLSIQPSSALAHMKIGQALIAQGLLAEGWLHYEWRYFSQIFLENNQVHIVPFPRWDGSSLKDKTILVNAEQGIGDEIMFASCFHDLIAEAEHIMIECDRRLQRLFQRSFPLADIKISSNIYPFYHSSDLPRIDWRIQAGSLPRFFRPNMDCFTSMPYLKTEEHLREKWRERLKLLDHDVHIGISWHGGVNVRAHEARSIPLSAWTDILATENVNFINLQYGDNTQELVEFQSRGLGRLINFEEIDPLVNLDDFTALISALDLVISIDNSTVHFTGAIGTPAWVLLPCGAEWRWMIDRSESVWYQSLHLYRNSQPGPEGWSMVLEQVANEIPAFIKKTISQKRRCESAVSSFEKQNEYIRVINCGDSRIATGQTTSGSLRKAVLLNDTTTWYHWGCTCTSIAIHEQLRKRFEDIHSVPIYHTSEMQYLPKNAKDFDDESVLQLFVKSQEKLMGILQKSDIIYINGEGTLHNINSQSMGLLYLAYIAKVFLNKEVHIINHSCFPDDIRTSSNSDKFLLYRKVYERMDFVAARENISVEILREMGVESTLSFDCLPLFIDQYYNKGAKQNDGKNVVIAGSVAWGANDNSCISDFIIRLHDAGYNPQLLFGANAYPASDDLHFMDILCRQCGTYFELVHAKSEVEWLRVIDQAKLLVSGRFHHSIAAAFLGTPFIVMESNTPKIEGLMSMLELDTTVSVTDPHLTDTLYQQAISMIAEPSSFLIGSCLRDKLRGLSLKNFH